MEKKLIGDRNEKFEDVDDKGRNFGTDHGRKYYWGITVLKNHRNGELIIIFFDQQL